MSEEPAAAAERAGWRVLAAVGALFGLIALIFSGIVGYVLATQDGPYDVVAIIGGFVWVFVVFGGAMALAAATGSVRGSVAQGPLEDVGAVVDREAWEARAWASRGHMASGEAEITIVSRKPALVMAAGALVPPPAGLAAYVLGHVTPLGAAVPAMLGAFLAYAAWLMWADARKGTGSRAPAP